MDTIGNFITIIRNASYAANLNCDAQWSKIREGIASVLKRKGYIKDYVIKTNDKGLKKITLYLKYDSSGNPAIVTIRRHSKPGCRKYYSVKEIPRPLNGLGMSVLSTSKGILDDKTARKEIVGGELLCEIW